MCDALDSSVKGKNTLEKLYDAASIYYNYSGTSTCFNLIDNSDPHDLGGWQWQVLSSTHPHNLFNFNCTIIILYFFFCQVSIFILNKFSHLRKHIF